MQLKTVGPLSSHEVRDRVLVAVSAAASSRTGSTSSAVLGIELVLLCTRSIVVSLNQCRDVVGIAVRCHGGHFVFENERYCVNVSHILFFYFIYYWITAHLC